MCVFFFVKVFYYSTSIFVQAGIPLPYVRYATLGTGAVNVIMTIISVNYLFYFHLTLETIVLFDVKKV